MTKTHLYLNQSLETPIPNYSLFCIKVTLNDVYNILTSRKITLFGAIHTVSFLSNTTTKASMYIKLRVHGFISEFIAATISAIVGIRVLNKTSEEYWFLMKFDLSYMNGNVDLKGINIMTDFFLVRLQPNARLKLIFFNFFFFLT